MIWVLGGASMFACNITPSHVPLPFAKKWPSRVARHEVLHQVRLASAPSACWLVSWQSAAAQTQLAVGGCASGLPKALCADALF